MQKSALITGITGQDGSYLAEYLLGLGYKVFGLVRRTSTPNYVNIEHILDKVTLLNGDLLDEGSLTQALIASQPDEVYNLAAQSFVAESWKSPIATADQNALGTLRLLEAIRSYNRKIRYYQAATSEMYGNEPAPQNEVSVFAPRSPYGVAKLFAYHITKNYRESYDMFACSGILFNHESPRRGIQFVTRKITDGVAQIKLGKLSKLQLGNLDAKRDWGYAGDYVIAMHMMLQQETPVDYVIGMGVTNTVGEFVQMAFEAAGIPDWENHIEINPAFVRPAEVNCLMADPTAANFKLGWTPKVHLRELVGMMVEADLKRHS